MRFHTDTLTPLDIHKAAIKAHVTLLKSEYRGSRTRSHAFEIALSGNSPFRTQADRDYSAATWDQWGIFINALFDADPEMVSRAYPTAARFHFETGSRFKTLDYAHSHRRHNWDYAGDALHMCECGAMWNHAPMPDDALVY